MRGERSVIGRPKEQARFLKKHQLFMEKWPNLKKAIDVAFARQVVLSSCVDKVVFALGNLCAEDFSEILLLCGNGYGFGAMKILRGMYERAVTARYLHQHPGEASAFVDFGWVSQYKLNERIKETFGEQVFNQCPDFKDQLEQTEKEYCEVKSQFMRGKKLNHTWSKLDFVTMAQRTGALGEPIFILLAYALPTQQVHSTMHAILSQVETGKDKRVILGQSSQEEADRCLDVAHGILLDVLDLQYTHFKFEDLRQPLQRCCDDLKWRKP